IKLDMAKKHSQEVDAAFDKDLKGGGFEKLRKAAPLFEKTLADYENATTKVAAELSGVKVQAYRIAASQAMVEQAEALLESYKKEKERDADGKKLMELQQSLEDLKGKVNSVMVAIKNPEGAAENVAKQVGLKVKDALVDSIVDGLLGGDNLKKEIAETNARIAAVSQRIKDLELGDKTAGVTEALNTFEADSQAATKTQLDFQLS